MMKKTMVIAGIIVLAIALTVAFIGSRKPDTPPGEKVSVSLFKSPTCGCCGVYAAYLKSKSFGVKISEVNDIEGFKREVGVPSAIESCHTMQIGEYFVEGHVPIEAINKLLSEKPDIKGIALPGMPPGTPGMPGAKDRAWIVYAVNNDGSYREFMRM